MTILTLNRKQLEEKIGKITPEIEDRITMFGTPVETSTEDEISVEIFPNRPDLLSLQGLSRSLIQFLKKPGIKKYKINPPQEDFKITIDKSVKQVRPFTVCAIIKNIKLDGNKIKELIEIQEKLHGSYGRNRKKLAVGIYPLEQIKLPITFLALPPEKIKFQPLEFPKEINGRQILSQHPTGREYADLLKDAEVFPIFKDANDEILSMPPIINSEKTGKVNENTKDIFIECSGFHPKYLQKTLNMIVTAIAEMDGDIYQMEIIDKPKSISPNLEPEKLEFNPETINKTLGLNLSEKQIKNNLEKMGIGYLKQGKNHFALIPSYRTDILHEIDLSEEVAIAYGYENFNPEIPQISTIGEEDKLSILKRKIAEILTGQGIQEISTFHISTKETQFKKIGIKEFQSKMIELIDSKTENNILRNSLLANSIKILSENLDASYPQKIFEIGKVFCHEDDCKAKTEIKESENLSISFSYEKANFTELKQILDYMMRMLDLQYQIKETENPSFINGRCGKIIINNKQVGIIGEITPLIIKNNKIKMPVASLEIDIQELQAK
ncbi:phenylalanine--tRNA ligase subunit beta [archaeon]|jgi:phenylalanyl-tRNA synthetase beta chain|nr:phenylalanine--tRNA ligase subunit beta [archaeon]MBT4241960.1 phenylalanine--tRNA ligase subunit beta [archaeon]MBT4418507.1 phenylalanine--tRNA ligase subunit beta [archaeon]